MTNFAYDIKENGAITSKEPEVGAWYCRYESIRSNPVVGEIAEPYERDGEIAEYVGQGLFEDEEGRVDMAMSLDTCFDSYLVKQGE